MHDLVHIAIDGPIGTIELARPDKFNCLSRAAWSEIDQARAAFEANANVRVIVIRARGENFCTGADLDEVTAIRNDLAKLRAFLDVGHRALLALEASPLPVVIAVQGLCLAGGLELMLAGDVVFAAHSARFGDQHAQFGLIPGWGGSQRLPTLIGQRRALELLLSARWLSADEAHAFGLVNYVSSDTGLDADTTAYAMQLAERSRQGLAQMKRLVRAGMKRSDADAMAAEASAAASHIMGADAEEGLAAFAARRKPAFD